MSNIQFKFYGRKQEQIQKNKGKKKSLNDYLFDSGIAEPVELINVNLSKFITISSISIKNE